MSAAPAPSTPDPNDPIIPMRFSTMRNLLAAGILAASGLVGGVGGSAVMRGEVPAELREALSEIRLTLSKLEGRQGTQDRDFVRLENRVEKLEQVTQELQRSKGAK